MKRFIAFAIILVIVIACAPDRNTQVQRTAQFGWTKIRDVDGDGLFTTTCNLDFDIKHYRGAVTLWIDPDTTGGGANQSDSASTFDLYLYNEESAEWGQHYEGIVKLDVAATGDMNIGSAGTDLYIPLANFNSEQWAWADKARITWTIGTGDKLKANVWVGGQ